MSNNTALELNAIRTLSATELDAVSGAKGGADTYYEMGGQWYVVHHNQSGRATGCEKVKGPPAQ
jgi:hypothetical protein